MDSFAHVKSSIPLNHTYYGPLHRDRLIAANKGKLAVVTGAGRGIGRAITVELANSGANVAVLDLGDTAETRAACEQFGVKALGFRCDVTDVARVREVLRDIERRLGPIDILVNNAGKNNKGRKVHEESFEESWSVVEACFKSTMICTYEVIKSMRKRGSGCIINIASRAALSNAPIDVPYCSAKAAIARATGCIQAQLEADGLGDQVQIYALHPGGVWTPMNSGMAEQFRDMLKPLLNDGPELCGATCAYLATGKAKALKGMLYDCRQDIERVTGVGRDTLVENRLYTLKMDYLQGYKDEV